MVFLVDCGRRYVLVRTRNKRLILSGALCLLFGTAIRILELRASNFQFETFLQADAYNSPPDMPVSRSGSIGRRYFRFTSTCVLAQIPTMH